MSEIVNCEEGNEDPRRTKRKNYMEEHMGLLFTEFKKSFSFKSYDCLDLGFLVFDRFWGSNDFFSNKWILFKFVDLKIS
jgi:hypothetical protein